MNKFDAPEKIETLRERDALLEKLWDQFADVPMDPESECIEERFMGWDAGTNREEIWHWFDARHSKGVVYLLYRDAASHTPKAARLLYYKQLCCECESTDCTYNHGGECRFALVHECRPDVNEESGCLDYKFNGGE